MGINNILSIASVLVFIPYFLLGNFKGEIRRAYLTYILLIFPLLDLFIIPFEYGGFTVFHVITIIFTTFLIILGEFKLLKFSSLNGFVFFCLIFSILLIGALNSFFLQKGIIEITKYLCIFIYMKLLIDECIDSKYFIKKTIYYIKIACLLSLIFLSCQIIIGVEIALYDLNPNITEYDSLTRFPSYFADAQIFGQFLAISGLLFLINILNTKSLKKNYFDLFLLAASTIGLFLSGSRAAFLGFLVGFVFIFIFSNSRFRNYSLFATGIMGLIVLLFHKKFVLFNREANIADTADLRYFYWEEALKIFSEFPFFGIGIGNYQNYVSLYSQEQYWDFFGDFVYLDHPENGYLKILVELGGLGFILIFGFLLRPLILSLFSFTYPKLRNPRLVVMVAAVLSWMIAFATVYSLNDIRIFVLIATLISLIKCECKKRSLS